MLAITLKAKEKDILEKDIVLSKCSVGNETGEVEPSINESTVQFENKKGNSQIDQSFQEVDKTEKKQESNYNSKVTKTTKQSKKETKKNKTNNSIYIIGIIIILLVGYTIYKFKKK